jgi:aldehyde dehydrogenase (NAD+)
VVYGGKQNRASLYIEPTLLTDVKVSDPIMQDEIFGPLLPIIEYTNFEEAVNIIRQHPNPLSFYIYTTSASNEKKWLQAVPSGGACVNNSSWHLTNHNLPFGGRGNSGTGAYHGKYSFETFSHKKSVLKTPNWFDPAMKYPPFKGKLKLFKLFIR